MPNHSLKNPASCYRVNKLYKENTTIADALDSSAAVAEKGAALQDIIGEIAAAANAPTPFWNVGGFFPVAQNFWMGKLRYDTSTKTGDVYVSDHRKLFTKTAFEFRKAVYEVIDATRMVVDMENMSSDHHSNPGGIADAAPGN